MGNIYSINQTTLLVLALFTDDYSQSIHLREISRRIQKDKKGIGVHLNRLVNRNVLKTATNGRNKEYSLNLGNTITKQYLGLAETFATINYLEDNFIIKKIVGDALDQIDGAVVLFGSYAVQEASNESDIDLLIITEGIVNVEPLHEVGRLIGKEINIQTINGDQFYTGLKKKDPLILEIIQKHIILKGVDNLVEIMWRYHGER